MFVRVDQIARLSLNLEVLFSEFDIYTSNDI